MGKLAYAFLHRRPNFGKQVIFPFTGGRAMHQAVISRPVTEETRVRARVSPYGICGGQSSNRTGFSPRSSVFPVSVIHRGSPYWGMNNKPTGECSSETQSHPIGMGFALRV
jgi:hypothetical protein